MRFPQKLQLAVLAPLALLGAILIGLVMVQAAKDSRIREREWARIEAAQAAREVSAFLETRFQVLGALGITDAVRSADPARILPLLQREETRANKAGLRLFLDLPDGRVFDTGGGIFRVGDRAYWSSVRSGRRVLEYLQNSRADGRPSLLLIEPVLQDGTLRCALSSTLATADLEEVMHRSRNLGEQVLLVAPDGAVAAGAGVADLRMGASSGAIPFRGRAWQATAGPLASPGWNVVLLRDPAPARETLQRLAALSAALVAGCLALAGLGMFWLLGRQLRPLRALAAEARAGRWPSMKAAADDEVGDFARALAGLHLELEEERHRHVSLFTYAPEGIVLIDPATGRFRDANPSALTLYQVHRDRLAGLGPEDLSPPFQPDGRSSREAVAAWIAAALEGEPQTFHWVHLGADGTEFPCEVRLVRMPGEPALVRASVLDLRDRERLSAALREEMTEAESLGSDLRHSRALLQAVLDSLPLGVWAVGLDRRIIIQSQVSVDTVADFRGMRVDEVPLPPDLVKRWRQGVDDGLSGQVQFGAVAWVDSQGHPRWSESRIAPVKADGEVIGVVGINLDITERKLAEENRHRSERLSALGQLASSVAHDFNNLLAGVQTLSELLRLRVEDPKLQTYAERIFSAVRAGRELTGALLRFARQGTGSVERYDAHATLREAAHLFRLAGSRAVELVEDYRAEASLISGRSGQLQNAVLNLCLNARDAMPDGGVLRIVTAVARLDVQACRTFSPATLLPGPAFKLTVADTGKGMAPEVMAHCLEPFFTTKGERGTGLGLAAVAAAVAEHHGGLKVDSVEGHGTTFTLVLPLAQELVGTPATELRRGTVLVVDDEPILREGIADFLHTVGFRSAALPDGNDAVAWVRADPSAVAMVLLDLNMANLGGLEAARLMRAQAPDLPILVVTGSADVETRRRLEAMPDLEVLEKPADPAEVYRRVAARVIADEEER